MAVRKITISIGEELLREIEALAEKANLSRSEWLAVAAKRAADREIMLPAMNAVLAQIAEREGAAKASRRTARASTKAVRKKRPRRRAAQ